MESVKRTKKGIFIREHKGFGVIVFSPFSGLFFAIAEKYEKDVISFCEDKVKKSISGSNIFDNLSIGIEKKRENNFKIQNWLPQKESFSFEDGLPDVPIVINWLISNKCNSKCKYCYASDVIDKNFKSNNIKNITKAILSYNPLAIVLSGGEPLLEKNKLVEAIELIGGKAGIILDTNGLIYDKELIKIFKKYNVVIRVSLDSLHNETNDKVRPQRTKRKNSLNIIIDNIVKYKKNDIPILMQTVITSVNKNTIDDMYKKLPALKINGWRLFSVASPNEEKEAGTFNEVMLFGRTKTIKEAQVDIQEKLKIFADDHVSNSDYTLDVVYKADTIKNSVILVLPSGEFVTENVFKNCKIHIDKNNPNNPVNIFGKTVDLRGHYERYLGKI
jgi:MoaA/NifB/PqqE/SkfB family radical SAM enzyme